MVEAGRVKQIKPRNKIGAIIPPPIIKCEFKTKKDLDEIEKSCIKQFKKFLVFHKNAQFIKELSLDDIEHRIYDKKENTKPSPSPKQNKKTTYQWQGNVEKELPILFKRMTDKFISPEITFDQFLAIFTGQLIDKSLQPVKWHNGNASELLFFNEILIGIKTKDAKVNFVQDKYKRMKACFVKSDGKPFNANFKVLKRDLAINLSQLKQDAIRTLFKGL